MVICNECGARVSPKVIMCPKCGAPVDATSVGPARIKRRKIPWRPFVVAALLVVAAGVAAYFFSR